MEDDNLLKESAEEVQIRRQKRNDAIEKAMIESLKAGIKENQKALEKVRNGICHVCEHKLHNDRSPCSEICNCNGAFWIPKRKEAGQ